MGTSPQQVSQAKQILIVISISVVATILLMLPIIYLNGPTDHGVRCDRLHQPARCEVLRSYLFGALGNSSFEIPQSEIRGAVARCSRSPMVGSRNVTPACAVYLEMEGKSDYPVLSYDYLFSSHGEAWARELNAYLANADATQIDLTNDGFFVLALQKTFIPLVLVLILAGVVLFFRRRRR